MRLIYFVQYFLPEKASGLQLVEDLLEGLAAHGWDVDLYTPTPTRGVTKEQRKAYAKMRIVKRCDGKVTIHRMHLYAEGRNFIARALRYLIFSIECFWKAITVPADFIFTGSGPPTQGVVAGLAKKISGKKFIYNLQDIFPDSLVTAGICSEKSLLMKVGRWMERFTYRHADVIITISDDMKENVLRKGVPPEKVAVVRNWIDIDKVKPVAREDNRLFDELNLPREQFYVVYAGNLGKVQGVEVIIEAARLLKDHTDLHFLIFGNGSEEGTIRKLGTDLPNISIFDLQPVERVSEVYSMGDVAIIPCKPGTGGSGMPSKTWTIMATGTPIIASFDLSGEMEQTMREADCGFCVEAGNAKDLSKLVIRLYQDHRLKRKLGRNARWYSEMNASKTRAVNMYLSIIERIAAKR